MTTRYLQRCLPASESDFPNEVSANEWRYIYKLLQALQRYFQRYYQMISGYSQMLSLYPPIIAQA